MKYLNKDLRKILSGTSFEQGWDWLSAGTLVVAVGLTPMLFTTASQELFEWPKMILIYGLSLIAVSLLGWRLALKGELRLPPRQLSASWLVYIGLFAISTGTSMAIYSSIMGYYSRFHGGLASVLAYAAVAWLAYIYMTDKGTDELWQRLKLVIYVWVSSASLVSVWAVLEHFGRDISCLILTGTFDASCWVQDVQARVFATFGQPNWLAAYLLTALPLGVVGLMQSKGSNRWLWLSLIWLQFAALWYTFSRSGWLGLAAVLGVLALTLPWDYIKQRWKWLVLVGAGCLAISLSSLQMAEQRTHSSLEGGDFDSSTGQMRLLVWEGSLKLIEEHPWLGSGPETFAYSFLSQRPAAMNLTTEWNFLYNKAHNEVLQIVTDRGWLGLVSWLGVWVCLIWLSLKSGLIRRLPTNNENIYSAALLSGMVGVVVCQLFGFSVVMTGLLWWLGMALMAAIASNQKTSKELVLRLNGWPLRSVVAVIMISVGLGGYGLSRYTEAELLSTTASQSSAIDNQLSRNPHRAALLNPWEPYYEQQLASHYAGQAAAAEESDRQQVLADIAGSYAEQAEALNPYNLITKKQLGAVYSQLRPLSERWARAEIDLWQRAVDLAPTDAASWWSLAKVYRQQHQVAEAERTYHKLIELRPVGEVYGDRASFYREVGQADKAAADLAKAAELEPWNDNWQ